MIADSICSEAVAFMREADDYSSQNRQEGLDDLRFSLGDQWPAQMQNSRRLEERPWFVVNEIDAYVRQVVNQIRQQRPRIKCHGLNTQQQAKTAEIITGICRHIQELSDADNAYDIGADFAARMGFGYWRVVADYVRDDAAEQEILIRPVYNPFSVSYDPFANAPDGSDQTRCLISDSIKKTVFLEQYPDADMTSFSHRAMGDDVTGWMDKESIRIAEFYRIDREKEKLWHLDDGTTWWDDEKPETARLEAAGVRVKGDRLSWRKRVRWYKITATQILDSRTLPGRYIPIVPVFGATIQLEGRKMHYGMVRMAKDPQRMLNFWQTNITEVIALAPKAKWLGPAAAFDGHEKEFDRANVTAYTRLPYNHADEAGQPIPPPERVAPEMPPEGAMVAAQAAHDNLQRVLGMWEPADQLRGNVSGKALNAEQQRSDMSQYHLYDNQTRSIKHTGRIILDWIPTYYGKKRVMRIIGDDGKPDLVTINDVQAIGKIENDLTIGEYDVVMETGPGYNSKRQETVAAMAPMLQGPNNQLMQVAGDLFFRNMDWPGADMIADRLAAANPLAQIDDKSDIPPRAQMMIAQAQKTIQGLQQQLQQAGLVAKFRTDVEAQREAGESHRLMLRESAETQRARERNQTELAREVIEDKTWRFDIESKVHSAQSVEELKGAVQLILHHLGARQETRRLEHEAAQAEREPKPNGATNA